jgi:ADP-heptose:LPS heptosyltransferase
MRLLVIRSSAMGDVALTVPALIGLRKQYPDVEVIMMTQKKFQPFFVSVPGLKFFFPDFRGIHKGLNGLIRLVRDVKNVHDPDFIIDLHDVLRSKFISLIFRLRGTPSFVIDKGRKEKKLLITGKKKVFLKHSVERYCDVFRKAGFCIEPEQSRSIIPAGSSVERVIPLLGTAMLNIGIAPFAMHKLKLWPEKYMTTLLKLISDNYPCRFFIFGGREDKENIRKFQKMIPGIKDVSELPGLEEELSLMSKLDLMITMDSSNMHMAALCGTRVVSIWGGTDPMAGFGPWMQPDNLAIRIPVEELDCRPCTIYGKGSSRRGLECMYRLTPEHVFERMKLLKVFVNG